MKDTLRDLFTFSAGERKGIIVLIFVVILISGYNLFLVMHRAAAREREDPSWMNDSGIMNRPAGGTLITDSGQELRPVAARDQPEKFILDPNTATYEELRRFGFNPHVSRTILKFRARGGKFRSPEDLKRMKGLDRFEFDRISGYIKILPGPEKSGKDINAGKTEYKLLVNINQADSALFEELPGIGPVLAKRIIRYRFLLGGFCSSLQIKEVYGISDSLYMRLEKMLVADTAGLRKINLNTATEKELARHPYLGRYAAAGIVRYRAQVTRISNINELKINGLLSEEAFNKIKKYLSI